MLTMQRALSLMLSITLICLPVSRLQADELNDCKETLELADKAIKGQAELISLQADQIEGLRFNYAQIKNQLDSERAWYKQPSIVVPLSFVAGAAAMAWAGRR